MNQYEIDYKQGYDKETNDEWLERIDKIRAEILEIIDKYKTEREE